MTDAKLDMRGSSFLRKASRRHRKFRGCGESIAVGKKFIVKTAILLFCDGQYNSCDVHDAHFYSACFEQLKRFEAVCRY